MIGHQTLTLNSAYTPIGRPWGENVICVSIHQRQRGPVSDVLSKNGPTERTQEGEGGKELHK